MRGGGGGGGGARGGVCMARTRICVTRSFSTQFTETTETHPHNHQPAALTCPTNGASHRFCSFVSLGFGLLRGLLGTRRFLGGGGGLLGGTSSASSAPLRRWWRGNEHVRMRTLLIFIT